MFKSIFILYQSIINQLVINLLFYTFYSLTLLYLYRLYNILHIGENEKKILKPLV